MAGPASNFILNIVELQNTITSASGLTPLASLSNTVSRLQEMVIYDEKRIATNTISAYNSGQITLQDPLVLASGVAVGGSGLDSTTLYGAVSSIGWGPSLLQFTSTNTAGATAIGFQVGVPVLTPMRLTADGVVRFPIAGTPAPGKYLTCMDGLGTAQWQTPALPSDERLKEDVRPLESEEGMGEKLDQLRGVRFRWRETGEEDVGFLAQNVREVLPELVDGSGAEGAEGADSLRVYYQKLIPFLLEEIKALRRRVAALELGPAGPAAP